MIIIDLEQGSPEWLNFRRTHVGSSDAASIMGMSPWKKKDKLLIEKLEGSTGFVNEAMKKGTRLEPIAREMINDFFGIEFIPMVGIHEERKWQSSSFDGVSPCKKYAIEIKCGGESLHKRTARGEIDDYYYCQCQHHYAVGDFETVYLISYFEGSIATHIVKRDEKFIQKMNAEEEQFNASMINEERPEDPYIEFSNEELSSLLKKYYEAGEQEKEIKSYKDSLKKEIIKKGPQVNFILDGAKIYTTQTTSYDFTRMRQNGINVEEYKKEVCSLLDDLTI